MSIPIDTLAFIIGKARAFDVQVEVDDPDTGSNPADDRQVGVLEDARDNPAGAGLQAILRDLNEDQLTELLALLWVGRGDYSRNEWPQAVQAARQARNRRVVRYLAGTPMLGDLIEEGLAELGVAVPLPEEEPQA